MVIFTDRARYGCTLTASAFDGTTNIMKALIDAKADVNKRGGDYGTPLQAAAYALYVPILNLSLILLDCLELPKMCSFYSIMELC